MVFKTKKQTYCPICSSYKRETEIINARDINHSTVPGTWNFARCSNCSCVYLEEAICDEDLPNAYIEYPTHNLNPNMELNTNKMWGRIKAGYLWNKYSYKLGEKYSAYGFLMYLFPPYIRFEWDSYMMHIPKNKKEGRLLDIGCGSGKFLLRAKSCGWDVCGVDFDKISVDIACSYGLNVQHGSIESIPNDQKFDVITISHVIEHVSNPAKLIGDCLSKLNSGGIISIATPNNEGYGIKKWKELWSSLETPRHIVIFNKKSLIFLMSKIGVLKYRFVKRGWHHAHVESESRKSNKILSPADRNNILWHLLEIKSMFSMKNSDELHILISR